MATINDNQYFELQSYKKNVSFEYEKLQLINENDQQNVIFNLWDNNFDLQNNIRISDDLKIRYSEENKVFTLKINNINGTIQTGQVDEILYFRPTSLIQSGLIYDMFNVLEDKVCQKLNINFLDIIDRLGLFRINCQQDIPLNKVVYFKDLIVVFDRVDKVNYRGKIKYCIVCNIVEGDILLQKQITFLQFNLIHKLVFFILSNTFVCLADNDISIFRLLKYFRY